MKNLARDTEIVRAVYNDAWHDNWGHVPLSREETAELAKSLRFLIKADYGVIVAFNGEPVGVGLLIPNVFELLADLDGRLVPFGWARLVRRLLAQRCRHARVAVFGVKRAIRDRSYGAGDSVLAMRLIMRSLLQGAWRHGFRVIDMGWILEDNRVRKIPEQYGAVLTKRYRIYERTCTAG
jgi:hypothetical protein